MSERDQRPARDPVVRLRGLERRFGADAGRVDALRGIDLDLARGEFVAIRGPSGSGKSTLLQLIGLLDEATAGSYHYNGTLVNELSERERTRLRNEEIGFVFQAFHLLADRSAVENVRLPLDYRRTAVEPYDPETMLNRVGLGSRCGHRPSEMSGGEQQRVAIARALAKKPSLLLCDEPTGNLDQKTGLEVLAMLEALHQEEGATLLLVTHSLEVANRAQRSLTLVDGKWEESS